MLAKKDCLIAFCIITTCLNMFASKGPVIVPQARDIIRTSLLGYLDDTLLPNEVIKELQEVEESSVAAEKGYDPKIFAKYLIDWFKSGTGKGWFGKTPEKKINSNFKEYLKRLKAKYDISYQKIDDMEEQGEESPALNIALGQAVQSLVENYLPLFLFNKEVQETILETIEKEGNVITPETIEYIIPLLKKEFLLADSASIPTLPVYGPEVPETGLPETPSPDIQALIYEAKNLINAYIQNEEKKPNFFQKLNGITSVITELVPDNADLAPLALFLKVAQINLGINTEELTDIERSMLQERVQMVAQSLDTFDNTLGMFQQNPAFILLFIINQQSLQQKLLQLFNAATQEEKQQLIPYLKNLLGRTNVMKELTDALTLFLYPEPTETPQKTFALKNLIFGFNNLRTSLEKIDKFITPKYKSSNK